MIFYFLDVDKLVDTAQRFRLTVVKMAEMTEFAQWKRFKSKIMGYLKDFYPLDIDDSYLEYVKTEVWWQWYFIVGRGETSQYRIWSWSKWQKWPKLRSYESASKLK